MVGLFRTKIGTSVIFLFLLSITAALVCDYIWTLLSQLKLSVQKGKTLVSVKVNSCQDFVPIIWSKIISAWHKNQETYHLCESGTKRSESVVLFISFTLN